MNQSNIKCKCILGYIKLNIVKFKWKSNLEFELTKYSDYWNFFLWNADFLYLIQYTYNSYMYINWIEQKSQKAFFVSEFSIHLKCIRILDIVGHKI